MIIIMQCNVYTIDFPDSMVLSSVQVGASHNIAGNTPINTIQEGKKANRDNYISIYDSFITSSLLHVDVSQTWDHVDDTPLGKS